MIQKTAIFSDLFWLEEKSNGKTQEKFLVFFWSERKPNWKTQKETQEDRQGREDEGIFNELLNM